MAAWTWHRASVCRANQAGPPQRIIYGGRNEVRDQTQVLAGRGMLRLPPPILHRGMTSHLVPPRRDVSSFGTLCFLPPLCAAGTVMVRSPTPPRYTMRVVALTGLRNTRNIKHMTGFQDAPAPHPWRLHSLVARATGAAACLLQPSVGATSISCHGRPRFSRDTPQAAAFSWVATHQPKKKELS